MSYSGIQVVWFKRDLRVADHAALCAAAARGPVLPVYVIEPEYWQLPDSSARHWRFVRASLSELSDALGSLGQSLIVHQGEVVEVFEQLSNQYKINTLWSHEETGNDWTFQRDKRVAAWCRDKGIAWTELSQNGVVRRLKSRNGWATRWDQTMRQSLLTPPHLEPITHVVNLVPNTPQDTNFSQTSAHEQSAGRQAGLDCLHSFLTVRGETYRSAMSNPIQGETACSRLSPHLAWGTVSIREAAQATWRHQTNAHGQWRGSLRSFSGRLHWHCHFMQKLEDEPRLEWENLHPAYNGLRPSSADGTRLTAWQNGETGLPFVDACMRYLNATGWLNFRMRAMLMSFAAYHLWLDWRAPGLHMARMFADYEPGIHWSQVQMQSGTTGINTIRIYNPVKQGLDQDPTGDFVRRWVPELAPIAGPAVHTPWKSDHADKILGKTYPFPIIDYEMAGKNARDRVWGLRGSSDHKENARRIVAKHASRRKPQRPMTNARQLSLFPDM